MDSGIKLQWVDALRGGQYEQGRGLLRTQGGKYCCLGVLADIAGASWQPMPASETDGLNPSYGLLLLDSDMTPPIVITTSLPSWLRDKYGLGFGEASSLMDLNDHHGYTFDEIADHIEENL